MFIFFGEESFSICQHLTNPTIYFWDCSELACLQCRVARCHPPYWSGQVQTVRLLGRLAVALPLLRNLAGLTNLPANTRISFHSVCVYGQLQKKFSVPTTQKKRKSFHKAALAKCKSSFPAPLRGCFYFFFSITHLSFSPLFSCCCSACANVFTLWFIGHLSALMALCSVRLSVRPCLMFSLIVALQPSASGSCCDARLLLRESDFASFVDSNVS